MKKIPYYAFSFSWRYYLFHPWKIFHELRTLFGNIKQRLLYSWDWISLWNMDSFLSTLIPDMLNELADRSMGAPFGDFEGSRWIEFEHWQAELHTLARLMSLLHYDYICDEEEFLANFDKWRSGELLKLIEGLKFYDEYKFPADGEERLAKATTKYAKLHEMREILMDVVFARLRGVWDTLWD